MATALCEDKTKSKEEQQLLRSCFPAAEMDLAPTKIPQGCAWCASVDKQQTKNTSVSYNQSEGQNVFTRDGILSCPRLLAPDHK